jgi:hypothetical protein
MDPWDLSPKNDIIVAWNLNVIDIEDSLLSEPDPECSRDIEATKAQFLVTNEDSGNSDWEKGEETEVITSIREFLDRTEGTKDEFEALVFPTVRLS